MALLRLVGLLGLVRLFGMFELSVSLLGKQVQSVITSGMGMKSLFEMMQFHAFKLKKVPRKMMLIGLDHDLKLLFGCLLEVRLF